MKLPQEFSERMKILLGEEYEEFLETYEKPRRYGLRVNTLKISAEEFERIAPFPVKRLPWIPGGYWYEKCGAEPVGETAAEEISDRQEAEEFREPSRHPFYYAGLYYLQEPSAMTPASVLPVEPGDRVLDICAAPGGKATALAAKLKGKGLLVANDISASRAKALLKNLEIFGVTNAFVTNAAPSRLESQFPLFFDKILVDAPCSGEGMFRKDAANARAWSLEKVEECAKIQKGILRSAVAMLRPGGMLLYSTCTFAPEEDEQAAAYLLREFPEMELCEIPWYEGFSPGRPEFARGATAEVLAQKKEESIRGEIAEVFAQKKEESIRGETAEVFAQKKEESIRSATAEVFAQKKEESVRCETDRASGQVTLAADAQGDEIAPILSRCVRIFPHKMRGEGHFLALFRKKEYGDAILSGREAKSDRAVKKAGKKGQSAAGPRQISQSFRKDRSGEAFSRKYFPKGGAPRKGFSSKDSAGTDREILQEFLRDVGRDFPGEQIEVRNGQVYLIPEAMPAVQGIPFLRNGLYMGEIRRGRFEPSQSFAMALRKDEYASVIDFSPDDERVYRYLKGETVDTDDIPPARAKGWQLVCAGGYPLGWGRLVGKTLKNKYHSGWRM